mmetsp:Transcript_31781/g.62060  ORF Transcript_31781/g.62060 Transcript_31781/m.62060 type:complete len:278 (-) Transcript_31781:701-1534(-)
MQDMPGKHRLGGWEPRSGVVQVQHRVHGQRRGAVHHLPRRHLEGHLRFQPLHRVLLRHMDIPLRHGRDRPRHMPQLRPGLVLVPRLCALHAVPLQYRVHGTRRVALRPLPGGVVQGCQRVGGVHGVCGGNVFDGLCSDYGRHVCVVPRQLDLELLLRCRQRLPVRGGLHGPRRRPHMPPVLDGLLQVVGGVSGLHAVQGGAVLCVAWRDGRQRVSHVPCQHILGGGVGGRGRVQGQRGILHGVVDPDPLPHRDVQGHGAEQLGGGVHAMLRGRHDAV